MGRFVASSSRFTVRVKLNDLATFSISALYVVIIKTGSNMTEVPLK